MLFSQLVCAGCCKILTYPLGAISCSCRNCGTVNSAQNIQVTCPYCYQKLLTPINTVTFLCPCCATITDIPEEMLPPVEDPVDFANSAASGSAKTLYVSYPTCVSTAQKEEVAREKEKEAVRRARTTERNARSKQQGGASSPVAGLNPLNSSSQGSPMIHTGNDSGDERRPTSKDRLRPAAGHDGKKSYSREEVEAHGSSAEENTSSDGEDRSPTLRRPVPTTMVIATRIL